jgi:hypothetical protein
VLREFSVLGATAGVFIALLALAAAAFYQATARVDKQARFEVTNGRDLTEIRNNITAIRGELAKLTLSANATLPLADFKANLPALRSSLANARSKNRRFLQNL